MISNVWFMLSIPSVRWWSCPSDCNGNAELFILNFHPSSSGQFFQLSFHNLKLFNLNFNSELIRIENWERFQKSIFSKNETSGMDFNWSTGLLAYYSPDNGSRNLNWFKSFEIAFSTVKIVDLKAFIRQKTCLAQVQPVMIVKEMHANGMKQPVDALLDHFQWHLPKLLLGLFSSNMWLILYDSFVWVKDNKVKFGNGRHGKHQLTSSCCSVSTTNVGFVTRFQRRSGWF